VPPAVPDPSPASPQPAAAQPALRRARWPLLAACVALLLGIFIGRTREPEVAAAPPLPATATPQPLLATQLEPAPAVLAEPPRQEAPLQADAPGPEPVTGPPGLVYFDSPRMIVSKNAVVAAVPMRNLTRVRRAVTVNWRIIEGTARIDRDFGGPMGGTESFVEGNSFRILYIPILQDPGATRDRRFTVEMIDVSAGTNLGPTPRIEVTILGAA